MKILCQITKKPNGRIFIGVIDATENCAMLKTDGKGKKGNNSNKFSFVFQKRLELFT